jgi:uncharacterized protein
MTYTIQELHDRKLIIAEFISGSNAYGTNTPESDTDIRGVFIQPLEDVLKYGFVEQVSDEKNDICFYELGRFFHLLIGNNPNIIELLDVPADCIIYKHKLYELIEASKAKFLTSRVRFTFAGYAVDQIQKARGFNKKMNWEESQMVRKSVLDFCYVLTKTGSILFPEWLQEQNALNRATFPEFPYLKQENFSLSKIDHAHDLYALYIHDGGIYSGKENANDVHLTSIPKGINPVAHFVFNKDAYSTHCRKFKEYTEWLTHRNENRVKMNKAHGKQYDSKNLMHCVRLLTMTSEMLELGKVIVRRPPEDIEFLMKIRRGDMEFEELMALAEGKMNALEEKYNNTMLPRDVNVEDAKALLLVIREMAYFGFMGNFSKYW